MNYVVYIGGSLVALAAAVGAFFAFRNILPDLLNYAFTKLLPLILDAIMKPMSPEEAEKWRQAQREGRPYKERPLDHSGENH